MICPDCHGTKTVRALVNRLNRGCAVEDIACPYCKGTGWTPEQSAEWLRVGQFLRRHRVKTVGLSQREMARRVGIDVVALSKMEQGMIDPAPYMMAYNEGKTMKGGRMP